MNTTLLQMLIASLIGGIVVVGGVMLKADDIIASAKSAAHTANVHQFATALELYYSDHQSYPNETNGPAMIEELYDEGYISSKPLDSTVFQYTVKSGGQDYALTASDN